MPTIYCITSIQDPYTYIQECEDYEASVSMHLKLLRAGKHPVHILQKMYETQGESSMIFAKIEDCEDGVLRKLAWRGMFSGQN